MGSICVIEMVLWIITFIAFLQVGLGIRNITWRKLKFNILQKVSLSIAM